MTPLSAEIIAIGSAMGWAGDSILVRFGLRQSNIFAAMLVSYTVSITCMWSYLITTTSLDFLRSPAMIYYLISGSMQPLFARALFTRASRVSASPAPGRCAAASRSSRPPSQLPSSTNSLVGGSSSARF